ncbi:MULTISPECIES: helix-turn-helix domain-containing protein [Methylococcus]|uniref:Helix-turn-helix domain-containing protein n=1 Tax=Methylococcus capsulatus TaxID=414 RepID=A0ABZ2F6H9_METCP|nr:MULTISPECIES: helix-turn-helix domain-containing protein [Methylococcus]MDF9392971.1 MerR family transcriptional regulator [Methylococcus capsulatus]
MNNDSRYSIDELAALAELPRRTVRYYVQQGLLDRPVGEKRAAYYTNRHLEQLLTIRKWQHAGLSLERIREILAGSGEAGLPPPRPRGPGTVEVWSHLVVADGLEVTLEPSRAGLSPEQVRAFFRGVNALYEQTRQEGQDDAEE